MNRQHAPSDNAPEDSLQPNVAICETGPGKLSVILISAPILGYALVQGFKVVNGEEVEVDSGMIATAILLVVATIFLAVTILAFTTITIDGPGQRVLVKRTFFLFPPLSSLVAFPLANVRRFEMCYSGRGKATMEIRFTDETTYTMDYRTGMDRPARRGLVDQATAALERIRGEQAHTVNPAAHVQAAAAGAPAGYGAQPPYPGAQPPYPGAQPPYPSGPFVNPAATSPYPAGPPPLQQPSYVPTGPPQAVVAKAPPERTSTIV